MRTTLAFLLAALLSACAGSAPRRAALDDLLGTWQLDAGVPPGARVPTMTVLRDGQLHGNGGVNQWRGTFDPTALARGQWRAGQPSSTRMAGSQDAMALEQAFLTAIAGADEAEIEGEFLRLKQGGRVAVVLVRPRF